MQSYLKHIAGHHTITNISSLILPSDSCIQLLWHSDVLCRKTFCDKTLQLTSLANTLPFNFRKWFCPFPKNAFQQPQQSVPGPVPLQVITAIRSKSESKRTSSYAQLSESKVPYTKCNLSDDIALLATVATMGEELEGQSEEHQSKDDSLHLCQKSYGNPANNYQDILT